MWEKEMLGTKIGLIGYMLAYTVCTLSEKGRYHSDTVEEPFGFHTEHFSEQFLKQPFFISGIS